MKKNIFKQSYSQYDADIRKLAKKIEIRCSKHGKFTYIFGIPRGGLPIAVHLSHLLGIPLLNETEVLEESNNVLLVDDISDRGNQLSEWMDSYAPSIGATATLYRKDGTNFEPDFCVKTVNKWVQFFWER